MKIYYLNRHNTRLWWTKSSWFRPPEYRPDIVKQLLAVSPEGAAVSVSTLRVVATVDSRGRITDLSPPYKVIEMHQICNLPSTPECQCFEWFSVSDARPWRDTAEAKRGGHHPICQFNRLALANMRDIRMWIPTKR
jgi:hypothetical protein